MRIVLIAAQSLDGFITKHDLPGTAWTSAADKAWFRRSLPQFDANVMGRVTYETIRTHLLSDLDPSRFRVVLTSSPDRFASDAQPEILEFSAESAANIATTLKNSGRHNCAILGGTRVHDDFLQAGLVDEIWATIEPKLFGIGTPVVKLPQDISLTLIDHQRLAASDSVLLKYRVRR